MQNRDYSGMEPPTPLGCKIVTLRRSTMYRSTMYREHLTSWFVTHAQTVCTRLSGFEPITRDYSIIYRSCWIYATTVICARKGSFLFAWLLKSNNYCMSENGKVV